MKKLFIMLIILFACYLGIQFLFNFFSKGESNSYIVKYEDIDFEVYENSNFVNNNNYSYSIKGERTTFNFQIDYNFNKKNHILEKIKYYKDKNYECILPIFKDNKIVIDMMCFDGKKVTYYYNLKGKSLPLDNFVKGISEYDINIFTDNSSVEQIEGLQIYKDNLIEDHYIAITNYKGVFDISKSFNSIAYNISLFDKDVYSTKISAFVNNYYITADYNAKYEFHKFNVVDLVKLDTKTISSDYKISLDSYVQGIVDGVLYLYDYDNKTQYAINVEKESIVAYTGNSLKYYDNGTWTTMTLAQANEGLTFKYEENEYKDNNYTRVDKVGQDVGYYYMYKKNENTYDVYSMDIQNEDSLKYLFSTKTIDNIYYVDNYIYFVNSNVIQVYSHNFGVKNLIKYSELQFNKNLNINIYSK